MDEILESMEESTRRTSKSSVAVQPIQLETSGSNVANNVSHKSYKSANSVKKGKAISKKGSTPIEPHYVCPLCKEDCPMSEAVKCNSGCLFCMLCTIRHFRANIRRKIGSVDCFLSCGESFILEDVKPFLPPILFNELCSLNLFLESLDTSNPNEPEDVNRSSASSSRKSTDEEKIDSDQEGSDVQIVEEFNVPEKVNPEDKNSNNSAASGKRRRNQDEDMKAKQSRTGTAATHDLSPPSRRDNANIEHHLLRLAVETEVTPRDPSMQGFIEEKPPSPSISNFSVNRGRGRGGHWRGGRGSYQRGRGRGRGNVLLNAFEDDMTIGDNRWRKHYNENQDKKDKEVVSILTDLTKELHDLKTLSEEDVAKIFDLLENYALLPYIESKLESCNFLEIERHANVYGAIIPMLKIFYERKELNRLLDALPHQKKSLKDLLKCLEKPAKIVMNNLQGKEVKLAKDIYELSQMVSDRIGEDNDAMDIVLEGESDEDHGADVGTSVEEIEDGNDSSKKKMEEEYKKVLSSKQYDQVSLAQSISLNKNLSKSVIPKKAMIRITQELSCLASSSTLPCSLSSSIFVRTDDSKLTFIKAVITGPSETPYMGGIFEFDVVFPDNYPSSPPKVTFKTTGGGRVRFNPNLYACGKVCLSLLNTWAGEQWDPKNSTILQVLVSIQSLVLVAEPFFNEPGYSNQKTMKKQSDAYNLRVFEDNLRHAILEQIRSPPEGFEDVVRSHFFYRRNSLIKELKDYYGLLGGDKEVEDEEDEGSSFKKEIETIKELVGVSVSLAGPSSGFFDSLSLPSLLGGAINSKSRRRGFTKKNKDNIQKLIEEVETELMKIEKPK